jgi:hypothetical protein
VLQPDTPKAFAVGFTRCIRQPHQFIATWLYHCSTVKGPAALLLFLESKASSSVLKHLD